MANIDSTKAAVLQSINEGASQGASMTITAKDIRNAGTFADNDTATFKIAVDANTEVERVSAYLEQAFDDSGAGDELNVTVGDGADPDGYLTSAQLHTDDTPITSVANTGAFVVGGSGARGKVYTSDDTIDILITPNASTGTDYSLNELTQGKLIVKAWFRSLK